MCLKQGNAHHKLIMIKVLSWTDAALYYTVRYLVLYINFRKGVIKMEREQMTIRLPAELKEKLQQEADKLGLSIEFVEVGAPFSKYALTKRYSDKRDEITAKLIIIR